MKVNAQYAETSLADLISVGDNGDLVKSACGVLVILS